MRHYLVIYDRRKGKILRHRGYKSVNAALRARFAAEREFNAQSDIEVVVLGAESWRALPSTHARYFNGVQELAANELIRLAKANE